MIDGDDGDDDEDDDEDDEDGGVEESGAIYPC